MSALRAIDPQVLPPESEQEFRTRDRVERFARMMDDGQAIPGLGIRFGMDSLIGLVPGIGDAVTFMMAFYLVAEAMRAGAPNSAISRMVVNIVLDSAAGSVPVVGDLFDVAFKSNRRNADLLKDWLGAGRHRVERKSKLEIALALVGIVLVLVLILVAALMVVAWIVHALGIRLL